MAEPEPIVASLATLPARVKLLEQSVASLLPQVDRLNVFLDGHRTVPEFLNQPKIETAHARDHAPIHGAGKFLWAATSTGYHFTCDDDMLYPPDYCTAMIEAIERHQRRAVVCVFGHRFLAQPTGLFDGSPVLTLKTDGFCPDDVHLHLPGTGTMAWHTSAFRIRPADGVRNMDDFSAGIAARQQNVTIVGVRRRDHWLTVLPTPGFTVRAVQMIGNITGDVAIDKAIGKHSPWPALPPLKDPMLIAKAAALIARAAARDRARRVGA